MLLGHDRILVKVHSKIFLHSCTIAGADVQRHQVNWGSKENEAFEKLKTSVTSESTMVYFNPSWPIVIRVKASYHEGLSAGLFQETGSGLRPIHFKSRTMTPTQKRYNQTEKGLLAIHWAKKRYSMYLLDTSKFQIITAHKHLLPLFNKASIKLPPCIQKWVMGMQRYRRKRIQVCISTEHAVVIDNIREETPSQLQKLSAKIRSGDWDKHKKDPDVAPFNEIHQEVSMVDDLIFRTNRIVITTSLQRKVIKAAHQLGHPG